MKKDQNLPNKKIQTNNSSGKPLPNISNYSRNQSPLTVIIEVDHQNNEIHKIFHKTDIIDQIAKITTIETTIHDQIQTEEKFLIPVPIQTLEKDTIQIIDHLVHHTLEVETTRITEIEVFQILETNVTKTTDQETIPITDLIVKETKTITI